MGITHFSDLRPSQALAFLQAEWRTTLKLDGSFIQFGLDDEGRFYTARKRGDRYHDVDDWPDMPWCNSFRSAHAMLEGVVDGLQEHGSIIAGDQFEAEIIWGSRPNTILYHDNHNTIVITRAPEGVLTNNDKRSPHEWMDLYGGGSIRASIWHTDDGINLQKLDSTQMWAVGTVREQVLDSHSVTNPRIYHLGRDKSNFCKDFENWFHMRSQFEEATVLDLLECRLNARPHFIPLEMWRSPAVGILKSHLKRARDKLREEYAAKLAYMSQSLTERVADAYSMDRGHQYEGFVVQGGGITCKFVHRSDFTKANRLSHWVRYALQGGSRPARPCFLSRTTHWTVERRLERLETLRARYIAKRRLLDFYGRNVTVSYLDKELNQRTLLLFAELRVRIRNGW